MTQAPSRRMLAGSYSLIEVARMPTTRLRLGFAPLADTHDASALGAAVARVRVVFGAERKLGPGKIDLLEAIGRTGSISAAGREMGMSYRRAWLLVDAVNRLFRRPVVIASAGGAHGGGAELTDFGRALVGAYRRIEARTQQAIREELAPFETDLVD